MNLKASNIDDMNERNNMSELKIGRKVATSNFYTQTTP
jgi:hypothetical protein